VASVLDIAVAWWLIPQHGAVGAALGSGAAQILAITFLWVMGVRKYHIRLPWAFLGKTTFTSLVAAGCAYAVVSHTQHVVGLIAGGIVAVVVFVALASLLRIFEAEDLKRFKVIVDACPAALAAPVNLTFSWISRRAQPAITEELP
jgi:O-antigen/teichoic acid export membrane protein